ncbi:MAG: hypothetical protein AAB769_01520 [Patescibacteria group bacterium]
MNKNTYIISAVVVILVLGGLGYYAYTKPSKPNPLDPFAQCINDTGTIFYGAFWCPHCQNQKKMFGSAEKLLPYIECSTPDAKGQTEECKDKGVTNYPTWVFPDTSVQTGEVSLAELAAKTGCVLPSQDVK